MALFELIKRCLDSGYELSIFKELGYVHIKVICKDYKKHYFDSNGNKQSLDDMIHKCEQIIPNDNHLYRMNEVVLFCIEKVDELRRENQRLLKQENHGEE